MHQTLPSRSGAYRIPPARLLVFLMLNIGTGLFAPVLSLLLLQRGATLATLPVAVGATILATCICEVPSGMAADIMGRRTVFIASMVLQITACSALLAGSGAWSLAAFSILRGVALAARTGTLDAIELDMAVRAHPRAEDRLAALDRVNGSLALLESFGVGAGGLAGAALAYLDPTYNLLIASGIGASAAALIGAAAFFPADARRDAPVSARLTTALAGMREAAGGRGGVPLVLAASVSAGAVMVAVETYWQPWFEGLAGGSETWMLGLVSCAGMAAAAVGSAGMMRLGSAAAGALGPQGRYVLYALLQAAAIGCLALVPLAPGAAAFTALYTLLYLILGARSVAEQTVLHFSASAEERSSLASVQSIALRGGGMAISVIGGGSIALVGLALSWPLFAAMAALPAVVGFSRHRRERGAGRHRRRPSAPLVTGCKAQAHHGEGEPCGEQR